MAAGAVGVVRVQSDPSAGTYVDRALTFLATHPTAKFHGSITVRGGTARAAIADAQTARADLAGAVQAPHRARAVIATDDGATELLRVDDAVYVRDAATIAALRNVSYVRADAQLRRIMRVRAEQAKALDVRDVLAAITGAKTLHRRGAVTTIEADVDPRALFGRALGRHVAWVTLRADVDDTGELHRAQVLTRAEASITTKMEFTDWTDKTIRIAAPAPELLDQTPPVARAKLASFKTAALVMPKTLPSGWELVRADVLPANDTQEGCAQAELAYEDQARGDTGFLYLYELPKSCVAAPEGAVLPFTAGNYNGFSAEADGPYVQITVGNTTVQAVTDLSLEELSQTLSELVPLVLQSS
jgi:hypothetical protein